MTRKRAWKQGAFRIALVALAAAWLISLPEPSEASLLHYRNAAVVLAAIIACGKILYDTLFFDHYV